MSEITIEEIKASIQQIEDELDAHSEKIEALQQDLDDRWTVVRQLHESIKTRREWLRLKIEGKDMREGDWV